MLRRLYELSYLTTLFSLLPHKWYDPALWTQSEGILQIYIGMRKRQEYIRRVGLSDQCMLTGVRQARPLTFRWQTGRQIESQAAFLGGRRALDTNTDNMGASYSCHEVLLLIAY